MPTELLQLTIDQETLRNVEARLAEFPRAFPKALTRAVNRTLGHIRTLAVRRASRQAQIPVRAIRRQAWVRRATQATLQGYMRGAKRGLSLTLFGARQGKTGVDATVPNKDRLMHIEHAFITRMPTGHEGVFLRVKPPEHYARRPTFGRKRTDNLPIREQTTQSLSYAIRMAGATPEIVAEGQRYLTQRCIAEANLILEGKRKA